MKLPAVFESSLESESLWLHTSGKNLTCPTTPVELPLRSIEHSSNKASKETSNVSRASKASRIKNNQPLQTVSRRTNFQL